MERSKRARITRILREALWSASPLRRFSPFRRFAASTLQRFNVSTPQRERASAFTLPKLRGRVSAFTLLELLIVVGIIGLLMVLIAPAFTTIKGGTDVTSAAYTIKDVLDTARTYAKGKQYLHLGWFFEEDVRLEPHQSRGQVQVSIVASKDGTDLGTGGGPPVDITSGVTPVGKLMRIDNIDIGDTGDAQQHNGTEFEGRPAVIAAYRVSSSGNTDYPLYRATNNIQSVRFNSVHGVKR